MNILFLIGRILFGGFFLMTGLNHFRKLDFMAGYAESKGVPMSKAGTVLTGVLLLVGGLGVLLGVLPQIAILLLILFLLPTTFMMHDFWNAEDDEKMNEKINFMKNLALIGALLMLLTMSGSWPLSL